jgi:two-component system, chemotaxis family, chemotaxis protein CheY
MSLVLVVDDSVSMRRMVTELFLSEGFDVVSAENGKAALQSAGEVDVDCVITDINMPVMDGLTLVRGLRAMPQYKYLPILVLTTESASIKEKCKEAGATGWIAKPFDPDSLIKTVNKLTG